jgi:hypothetical protein
MAKDDVPSSILHSPSSLPAQPLPLAYDDLPPGSDLRREYGGGDGVGGGGNAGGDDRTVKIIVPAGEPPAPAMKIALYDSFASGTRASWALLLLSFLLFSMGLRNNRISGVSLAWAWAFFAIFCAALVLLVVWVRYGMTLDAIRIGREQMTILAATPTRLVIETTGPFGVASYNFPRDKLTALTIRRGVLRDDRNLPRRVLHLAISLADGRTICLLPGRDARELQWVRGTVGETMGLN